MAAERTVPKFDSSSIKMTKSAEHKLLGFLLRTEVKIVNNLIDNYWKI